MPVETTREALRSRAADALAAHAKLLQVMEQEPCREPDPDPERAAEWIRWHDDVFQRAWRERDEAITPLLAHPDYARAHRDVWRDEITASSRIPYVWRMVARELTKGTR